MSWLQLLGPKRSIPKSCRSLLVPLATLQERQAMLLSFLVVRLVHRIPMRNMRRRRKRREPLMLFVHIVSIGTTLSICQHTCSYSVQELAIHAATENQFASLLSSCRESGQSKPKSKNFLRRLRKWRQLQQGLGELLLSPEFRIVRSARVLHRLRF